MSKSKSKILVLDIENSQMIISGFPTYNLWDIKHIDPMYIEHDWYLTCAAWLWVDAENGTYSRSYGVSTLDDPKAYKKNFRDDLVVTKKLHEVIQEADLIIGHNSNAFDLKKINQKIIDYQLPTLDYPPTVDTLLVNRKYGKASSNSLAHLCRHYGISQKMALPKGVMHAADRGCAKSMKKLITYNKQDIVSTAQLYLRLLPYIKNHPDIRRIMGDINSPREGETTMQCGTCGSKDVHKNGIRVTKTGKYNRYLCKACGSSTRGPKVEL